MTKTATLGAALALLLSACSGEPGREIRLLSGESEQELASSHMARAVLEQAGFEVSIGRANLGQSWQRLWAGEADASLSIWMPEASAPFVERFFERLHDLGPNYLGPGLDGTRRPAGDRPHTLARRALEQDAPEALAILAGLRWQQPELERVLAEWEQSGDWEQAAAAWLAQRQPPAAPE
ncbi:glycine betaine ABC transporter substrate-binding protein [Zobellella sp. An-6]|uniref:glycine betaine ABC transporter substrate-binding protein n=1 Tax=Zobellella sp. An-6 TaxID=3400218 RepID=UPI004042708C